jgi:hypothetical protein
MAAVLLTLQTQWRVGAGGASGLDYNATVQHKMDRMQARARRVRGARSVTSG